MSKVRLKDIGIILTGNTPKTSEKENYSFNDICFVKPSDISDNEITEIHSTEYYISEYARSKARILPVNSVLVTCIGIIGKVAINEIECAFNQQINAIIPDSSKYVSKFIAYAIQNERRMLQDIANAPIVPIMNKTEFSNVKIKIYPLEKQEEIVAKLDSIEKVIQYHKELFEIHDGTIRSRFLEMFGEPFLNPKNWDVAKIGDVVTEVRYGTSRPAVEGGKYPYLRMNNLTFDGHLDLTDMKYIDIPDNEMEKCIVRKGDVLFNRTNSVELVGKTCVFDLEEEMVIAGYIIRVRLNEKILPVFLSNYMNSAILKEHLRSMAKGAVNQANINAQELQGIKIYMPPIELQHQFADFVEQVEKAKQVIQQQLEELETLKKSLMQKYFG